VLFVVGSYHVGKERAYLGAAHALGWRVHCSPAKHRLLRLLGLPRHWLDLVTAVPEEAQVGARMAAPWLACAAPRVLCVAG
jgi:DNA cross-link repair 1A protein